MPKRTPLYEEHRNLGAKIVEFAGWEMPIQYTGVTEEHLAVRNTAGLFDVSHMGIFEVSGKDSADLLDYLTPSSNKDLGINQAQYSFFLTDRGTFVDDIIIYRLAVDKFFLVVNASNREKDFNWIGNHQKGNAKLADVSNDYTLLALQGPMAAIILNMIATQDLNQISPFQITTNDLKGIGKTILARTGYTGEDGFEIFVSSDKAVKLWNTLLEIGKAEGLRPTGLAARDTLRLEMKYSLYGHEINESTNALEAGLRWVIRFKKPADFIGKNALLKIKGEGSTRKLIGFRMIDRGIPRQGYPILHKNEKIGEVTSGTFSPSLQIPIGIGYVKIDHAEEGSKITIDIRGKERLAEVVKTPFYRKNKSPHPYECGDKS